MPIAIITGAGSGIGRATALHLAAAGYVVVLASRTASALQAVAEAVRQAGGRSLVVATDVSDASHVDKLIDAALQNFGEINVVINAAGVAPMIPTPDLTPAQWREIIDTNLSAVFYTTRAVWPHMRRQHQEFIADHRGRKGEAAIPRDAITGGVIVNISSMAARDPFPGLGAYAAAKIGVNMLTQVLAREGEPLGIRVHAIAPAGVETPMLRALFTSDQLPGEEILRPEEVAEMIFEVVQGAARFTSGETIYVHRRV